MFKTTKMLSFAAVAAIAAAAVAAPPPKKAAPRPVKSTVKKIEVNSAAYQPVRDSHIILFNHRGDILFDQRVIGRKELRSKIRMITKDRPMPLITVRYEDGADRKLVAHANELLAKAGFKDVKNEKAYRSRPMRGPKREKPSMWNPANWF